VSESATPASKAVAKFFMMFLPAPRAAPPQIASRQREALFFEPRKK
jgi:hypothetical protein